MRSSKRQRSAVLELATEGRTPRRSKGISYDAASRSLRDGKRTFVVPSKDTPLVTRSLTLLCKVSSIRLEHLGEAARQRVGLGTEPSPSQ